MRQPVPKLADEIRQCADLIEHDNWRKNAFDRLLKATSQLAAWERDFVGNHARRPVIVCLCGSTRFTEAYQRARLAETIAGRIVLTTGCDTKSDGELFAAETDEERAVIIERVSRLHLRKIDLADQVLIMDVGEYIGDSTRREIEYAREHGKQIRYLTKECKHLDVEELDQIDGYPGGDIVIGRCNDCGKRLRAELPQ